MIHLIISCNFFLSFYSVYSSSKIQTKTTVIVLCLLVIHSYEQDNFTHVSKNIEFKIQMQLSCLVAWTICSRRWANKGTIKQLWYIYTLSVKFKFFYIQNVSIKTLKNISHFSYYREMITIYYCMKPRFIWKNNRCVDAVMRAKQIAIINRSHHKNIFVHTYTAV